MLLRRSVQGAALAAAVSLSLTACTQIERAPLGGQKADARAELANKSQALTAPTTYLVVYKLPSLPLTAALDITLAGGKLVSTFPLIGVVVAQSSSDTFVSKLSKNILVEGVAATGAAQINLTPTNFTPLLPLPTLSSAPAPTPGAEPLSGYQWNMEQIHASQARAITQGKRSVVVGVFDSGIDDSHQDLQGQVDVKRSVSCVGGIPDDSAAAWRADQAGHGTAVAGLIAAKKNGKGIVGIAPGVSLAAIKVSQVVYYPEYDYNYHAVFPEAFVCGLYWAASRGINLVNASLALDPWLYNCSTDPQQKTIVTATQRALNYAALRGVTVVAAASNEAEDLAHKSVDPYTGAAVTPECKLLPVEASGVIGVSAVGASRELAFYSNTGLGAIDFAAPGGDMFVPTTGNDLGQVLSTAPKTSQYYNEAGGWGGRVAVGCTDGLDANDPSSDPTTCAETYMQLQGTSMATPHVTGIAALALSKFGPMSTAQLIDRLRAGATPKACPPDTTCEGTTVYNGFFGYGLVDSLNTID
jgi:subtilisin family serine protease